MTVHLFISRSNGRKDIKFIIQVEKKAIQNAITYICSWDVILCDN